MESHSTMEHKIRILIDLASRAADLSRELLQPVRELADEEKSPFHYKARVVREIDFTFAA